MTTKIITVPVGLGKSGTPNKEKSTTYEEYYKLTQTADFEQLMELAPTVEPLKLVQIESINTRIKRRFIENNGLHQFMRENPNDSEFYKRMGWEQTRGVQKSWKSKIVACSKLDMDLYALLVKFLDMRDQYNEVVKAWKANKYVHVPKEKKPEAPQFGNLEKECIEIIEKMGEDFKQNTIVKTKLWYERMISEFKKLTATDIQKALDDYKNENHKFINNMRNSGLVKEKTKYAHDYVLVSKEELAKKIEIGCEAAGEETKRLFFCRIIPKLTCLNLAGKTDSWSYTGENYYYTIDVKMKDGSLLTVTARIVYNVSPLGTYFNQFPITFGLAAKGSKQRGFLSEHEIKMKLNPNNL